MAVGKTFVPLFLAAAMVAGCAKPPSRFQEEPPPPEPTKEAQVLFDAMQALEKRARAANIDSYHLQLALIDAFGAASKKEPSCRKTAGSTAVRFYINDGQWTPTAGVFHGKVGKLLAGYCYEGKLNPEELNVIYRYATPVVQNLNPWNRGQLPEF